MLEATSTLGAQIDDAAHREQIAAMVEPILTAERGRAADPSGFYLAPQGEIMFHHEVMLIEDELRAALDLPHEEERSKALAALVPRLPVHLLPDALAAALAMDEDLYRAWALERVAPRLDGDLLQRALAGRFDYDNISVSITAITHLAARISEPTRLRLLAFALEQARSIGNTWWRLEVLEMLFPLLTGDLQLAAAPTWLETANALPSTPMTESAKVRAAYHTGEKVDAARFIEVIDLIWSEDDSFLSSGAGFKLGIKIARIRPLLAYLPPDQKCSVLDRVVEQVMMPDDEIYFNNAVEQLAAYLPAESLDRLVTRALGIADERVRADMLGTLIDHQPEIVAGSPLIDAVMGMSDPSWRANGLIHLAKRLDGAQRAAFLERAYAFALDTPESRHQLRLLIELAQMGVKGAYEAAMTQAQSLADERERIWTIAGLISIAPNPTNAIRQIRLGVLARLRALRLEGRASVLLLLSEEPTFAVPVFSHSLVTACAETLLTIMERTFPRP